jgi:hypothetical protein
MTDIASRSHTIRSLASLAVATGLLSFASSARAQDPLPDPSANRTPSGATNQACFSEPSSQTCVTDALGDLNAARVSEGVVPLVLPGDWGSLTIPQQLLVLSNLERIDRGLVPIDGLSTPLDADAQTGAAADKDPQPTNFYGDTWTANWEGGYVSPLLSDFAWMYDDGFGSGNLDCTSPGDQHCWGHRHDILWDFTAPTVMGAAYDATSADGASETELFVGGDQQTGSGQPDAPIAPTWTTIAATLPIGLSAATVSLANGARTAELTAWASGETMHVAATVTSGTSTWSVSPSSCQLSPGQSCALTLASATATPGPGSGTLTLTGPNGTQTVALSGPAPPPVTPKISAKLNHSTIHHGKTTKLSGSVSSYKPGTDVELQQRHGKRWRNVAKVELRLGGQFSFTIRGHSKGKFSYRVSIAAATGFTSGTSKALTLHVT